MSSIFYYSKYCDVCKKYLQILAKMNLQKEIHFICIDRRTTDSNNTTHVILENNQQIILPENVTRVPALLLLNNGYKVLFGEQILQHLKPSQEVEVKKATQNNMEPMAFAFNSGFNNIISDQYSFLDQTHEDLEAKGNGGMRQMHNYVDLSTAHNGEITKSNEDDNTTIRGTKKMGEDDSNQEMDSRMKRMQEQRDSDLKMITGNKPPMSF